MCEKIHGTGNIPLEHPPLADSVLFASVELLAFPTPSIRPKAVLTLSLPGFPNDNEVEMADDEEGEITT